MSRWPAGLLACLACLLAAVAHASGPHRSLQQVTGARLAFPYSRTRTLQVGPYTVDIVSVTQSAAGQQVCFKINPKEDACATLSDVSLKCCEALKKDLHKLEVEVVSTCAAAVAGVTANGQRKSHQFFTQYPSGLFKISNLGLDYTTASKTTYCVQLKAPCGTYQEFLMDGKVRAAVFSRGNVDGLRPKDGRTCSAITSGTINDSAATPGGKPPVVKPPTTKPSPKSPKPSPSPKRSPTPKPSPSPKRSPAPKPSPKTPSPTASPAPSPTPSPKPTPSPVSKPRGAVVPYTQRGLPVDYATTNLKAQVYDVTTNSTHVQVTVQATVQDIPTCSAAGAGRACDNVKGLAISVDPAVYGNATGLLDPSKTVVTVDNGSGEPVTVDNGLKVKVSDSEIPVVGCELPKALSSNNAVRATFAIPRVVPTPAGSPDPSPSTVQVFAWGDNQYTNTTLSVTKPVNNAAVLDNTGAGPANAAQQPLSNSGMQFVVTKVGGSPGNSTFRLRAARPANGTQDALDQNEPLYVRVPLTPGAANSLVTRPRTSPSAVANIPASGNDLTFTVAPSAGNDLVYQWTVPGNKDIKDVCKQQAVQDQPDNTCVVELIGSGGSTWTGVATTPAVPVPSPVNPPPAYPPVQPAYPPPVVALSPPPAYPPAYPPLAPVYPPPPPPSGFTGYDLRNFNLFNVSQTQKPLQQTNFDAALYRKALSNGNNTLTVEYQVTAADQATCKRFNQGRECSPLDGFGVLLLPEVFGTGWDVSTTQATLVDTTRKSTLRTAAGDGTGANPPILGVQFNPPLGSNEVCLVRFVIQKKAGVAGRRSLLQTTTTPGTTVGEEHPVIAWGPNFTGQKPITTSKPIFNPTILNDPDYGLNTGITSLPLVASNMELAALSSLGNPRKLELRMADKSSVDQDPPAMQRPLYFRMFLTPEAVAAGKASPALAPAPTSASAAGKAVTWTVAPTPESTFQYLYELPASLTLANQGLNKVCRQGVLPDQPNNTCAMQIISSNQTVYNQFFTPEEMGLTPSSSLSRSLPNLVTSQANPFPMEDTNWGAQLYNASENTTHVTLDYLVSVSSLSTCKAAGLASCGTLTNVAMAIDTTRLAADTLLQNMTVRNPAWGTTPPTININSNAGNATAFVSIAEPREIGAGGPTSEVYSIDIPKREGAGFGILGTGPTPVPPLGAVLLSNQNARSVVGVGDPSQGPPLAYIGEILTNANYTGSDPGASKPLNSTNCLAYALSRAASADNTNLSLDVNAFTANAGCRELINNELQEPVYMRVLLSPKATQALTSSPAADINPRAGSTLPLIPAVNATSLGGAVTWANVPNFGNSFTYGLRLPGSWAVNDVCAQNQVPSQPVDTCVVQLISGGNKTVWSGVVREVMSPAPPMVPRDINFSPLPSSSGSGLSYNEKLAIIICSVVGGILLLLLCCLALLFCYRRRQKMWAPAKSAVYNRDPLPTSPSSLPVINSTTSIPPPSARPSNVNAQDNSQSPGPDSQVSAGALSNLRPGSTLSGGNSVVGGGAGGAPSLAAGSTISGAPSTFLPPPPSYLKDSSPEIYPK